MNLYERLAFTMMKMTLQLRRGYYRSMWLKAVIQDDEASMFEAQAVLYRIHRVEPEWNEAVQIIEETQSEALAPSREGGTRLGLLARESAFMVLNQALEYVYGQKPHFPYKQEAV